MDWLFVSASEESARRGEGRRDEQGMQTKRERERERDNCQKEAIHWKGEGGDWAVGMWHDGLLDSGIPVPEAI